MLMGCLKEYNRNERQNITCDNKYNANNKYNVTYNPGSPSVRGGNFKKRNDILHNVRVQVYRVS